MRRTALTLLALAACKDKEPERPPPPPPPHDGVTLIQPGAAPFQPLRYRPSKGARTTSELVSDLDARTDGQGGPMPSVVVDLETTIEDVLPDGTAKLRIAILQASVRERPGMAIAIDLVRDQVAAMRGVVFTQTLAPDGALSDARVESAAALPDKVREQLDSLSHNLESLAMRMPVEPVGIGATWRERKTLPEGGIRAVAEITYTLTSLTGETIAYTSTGTAVGGPHSLEQDGTKVEVTEARGSSQARGSVDLSRYALSVTSSATFSTTLNVLAPKGTPGAGPSTVDVTISLQVSPAEPPEGTTPDAISAGVTTPSPGSANAAAPNAAAPNPAAPNPAAPNPAAPNPAAPNAAAPAAPRAAAPRAAAPGGAPSAPAGADQGAHNAP